MQTKFLQKGSGFPIHHSTTKKAWCLPTAFQAGCVLLLLLTASFADAAKVEDFIPRESVLYVKLQDLDVVYSEIETSESWEEVFALFPDTPDWQQLQQGVKTVQGFLGTDLLSVLETVGYRTALAVWSYREKKPKMGLVVHSGGNLSELQRLTKIVEGFIGMSDTNTLHVDAGEYQRVRYNMTQVNQQYTVKYGFVDEFLVLGVGDGAFEELMDTFRKKAPSIAENTSYAEISEKSGSGQVSIFCATHQIPKDTGEADVLGAVLAELLLDVLRSFEVMFGEINLLETGKFFTLQGQFTPESIEQFHQLVPNSEPRLKEKNPFKTVKALNSDVALFVGISPIVSEVIWQLLRKFIAQAADDDIYAGVSFLEGTLNLNLEDDIFPGLTGEVAIAVNDFTQFDSTAFENMEANFDGTFTLDARGAETQGTLIFSASNPLKWDQLNNSVFNLQNLSVTQTDYNGVQVSTFATNLHHSTVNGLSLFGASAAQMHALIDEIRNGKSPVYLKQMPKSPIAIAQLNLARALQIEKGAPPSDRVLVNSSEISLVLAWISVKAGEALLEATLSQKETGLEALARLMPFLIWNMEQR